MNSGSKEKLMEMKTLIVSTSLALGASLILLGCTDQNESSGNKEKSSDEQNKSSNEQNEKNANAKVDDRLLVVKAQLKDLKNQIDVPGELRAYQDVPIHAKVEGFVSWIGVDRGSWVKKGQKMITISCPELIEKIDEANAKLSAAQAVVTRAEASLENVRAKLLEDKAKLESDEQTYTRLQEAAKTPGAVAQNDVDVAQKTVEGDRGRMEATKAAISAAVAVVRAEEKNVAASERVFKSLRAMQAYLTIVAPFDGVISSRNVHEGSIVAVGSSRESEPLVRIQQVSQLRLVAAIPEDAVGILHEGDKVKFTVAAFPGREFYGKVARPAFSLDTATRTMPVELAINNTPRVLDPGMYCNVEWVVSRPYKTIFLPTSAVGTDLVGSFVNKVENGVIKRVPVSKGDQMDEMVEVTGNLSDGDLVALKATNERKDGSEVKIQIASTEQMHEATKKKEKASGE